MSSLQLLYQILSSYSSPSSSVLNFLLLFQLPLAFYCGFYFHHINSHSHLPSQLHPCNVLLFLSINLSLSFRSSVFLYVLSPTSSIASFFSPSFLHPSTQTSFHPYFITHHFFPHRGFLSILVSFPLISSSTRLPFPTFIPHLLSSPQLSLLQTFFFSSSVIPQLFINLFFSCSFFIVIPVSQFSLFLPPFLVFSSPFH